MKRRKKHAVAAKLARQAVELRFTNPRPTARQIAAKLGVSYWFVRHALAGEIKAMFKAGYFHY